MSKKRESMAEINQLVPREELETMSRRDRKKHETRWRIYTSAIELFRSRDFDTVKIEEICEAADVSNAAFFHHFSSKASLISAYWDELKTNIREQLASSPDVSAKEKLEIISTVVARTSKETSAFTPQLFGAIASGERTLDMEHIDTGITGTLTEIIRDGQKSGEFNKDTPPELVAVNLAASWILLPLAMKSPEFTKNAHKKLLAYTLNGLGGS